MYHRVRGTLLKAPNPPFIGLSQQAIQILTDEGGFLSDLLHGKKSSGETEAASGWSRNQERNGVLHRRSDILLPSG